MCIMCLAGECRACDPGGRAIEDSEKKPMSLYINETWTRRVADKLWMAEAQALSSNSNDVTISAVSDTPEEANQQLIRGLIELGLLPKRYEKQPDANHEEVETS